MQVPTLEAGRTLPVTVERVLAPGSQQRLAGQGMPMSKSPGTRGDMVITWDVVFPASLSPQLKAQLRPILAGA